MRNFTASKQALPALLLTTQSLPAAKLGEKKRRRVATRKAAFFPVLCLLMSGAPQVSNALPLTGPNGRILSVSTTVPVADFVGTYSGCIGSTAADCTVDGNTSGTGGYVHHLFTGGLATFSYELDGEWDITQFLLWNDRGTGVVPAADITDVAAAQFVRDSRPLEQAAVLGRPPCFHAIRHRSSTLPAQFDRCL